MKWVHIAITLIGVTLVYGDDGQAAADRQQRILAAYSTRTVLSMTTTTVTSVYTCASAVNGQTCFRGRKMRRFSLLESSDNDMETDLSSSQSEDISEVAGELREPRIALTVWSTTTTPYTWISTSINSATTLSISYWCSVAGEAFPPACG